MPETCEECGKEKGYSEFIYLECEFGYNHSICKNCMKNIKKKANE